MSVESWQLYSNWSFLNQNFQNMQNSCFICRWILPRFDLIFPALILRDPFGRGLAPARPHSLDSPNSRSTTNTDAILLCGNFCCSIFCASPLLPPVPWASPPPCHPLLFSMSSLIAVGDALVSIGTETIAGDAMTTGKLMLLCYCYFVTFSLSDEIYHSQK